MIINTIMSFVSILLCVGLIGFAIYNIYLIIIESKIADDEETPVDAFVKWLVYMDNKECSHSNFYACMYNEINMAMDYLYYEHYTMPDYHASYIAVKRLIKIYKKDFNIIQQLNVVSAYRIIHKLYDVRKDFAAKELEEDNGNEQ